MDNNIFSSADNIPSQNAILMDGIVSQMSSNPPLMDQNFSMLLRDSSAFAPFPQWNINRDSAQMGGSDLVNSLLANTFQASRTDDVRENHDNLAITAPPVYPLSQFRPYVCDDSSNGLNSSVVTLADCRYDEGFCGTDNDKWGFEARTGFHACSGIGAVGPSIKMSSIGENLSVDFPFGMSKNSNELSLSLATSHPGIVGGTNISDQCSEIGLFAAAATRLTSEQASCSSKDLSLSFPSSGPAGFSQLILGSKYLQAIQEILTQIASCSLESSEGPSGYSARETGSRANSAFPSCIWKLTEFLDVDYNNLELGSGPASQRLSLEAKKAQLLNLLQVVDDRYSHCLDEIHTVVSAFHAATELDPQLHTRFALQTISFLYKNLRERISNQILAMGSLFENGCVRGKEKAQENSFVQQQWALQQLRRKNHQLWRPQRGLPETSVSILRAWMFQNFLHPYPKDSEKHLLAIKSGLTRSQVSNWFINARVRLWKPMIEEMCLEMNRRKTNRGDGGDEGSLRRRTTVDNHHHHHHWRFS